jgi:hypothetical protein
MLKKNTGNSQMKKSGDRKKTRTEKLLKDWLRSFTYSYLYVTSPRLSDNQHLDFFTNFFMVKQGSKLLDPGNWFTVNGDNNVTALDPRGACRTPINDARDQNTSVNC